MSENHKTPQESAESESVVCSEQEFVSSESDLTSLEKELRDTQEKYLRSLADFENHRKRALKERSELVKYQGEAIFRDLLEVVDNFDLALSHLDCDAQQMRKGIEMIHQMFSAFLSKWEVKGVSSVGQNFDPSAQNAISTAPAVEGLEPGQVVAELKKAYFYKDKLIRPGDVIVAVASGEGNS